MSQQCDIPGVQIDRKGLDEFVKKHNFIAWYGPVIVPFSAPAYSTCVNVVLHLSINCCAHIENAIASWSCRRETSAQDNINIGLFNVHVQLWSF